ncbi:MAG: hypothetical protein RL701_837 [Pseudomonadota bacterium]
MIASWRTSIYDQLPEKLVHILREDIGPLRGDRLGAPRSVHELEVELCDDGWGRQARPPKEAIAEVNHRFRESGYEYAAGKLVRVDSQVLHADVVKPAFALLSERGSSRPNAEFLTAYEHMRHGHLEAAAVDAVVFRAEVIRPCNM